MSAPRKKGKSTRAVLFWPATDQVSTEDVALVREEDRFVNFPTTVTMNGTSYKAVVRCISDNPATLKEMEMKVAEEIEERTQKQKEDLTREQRTRGQRKKAQGNATANQVAAAFRERIKPPPALEKQAQKLKAAGAEEASTRQTVELLVDAGVSETAKRNLFGNDEGIDDSDKDSSVEGGSFHEEDDEEEQKGKDDLSHGEENSCPSCTELRTAMMKPVPEFLSVLQGLCLNRSEKAIHRTLALKEIPQDVPKTLLSKGYKIFISVHDKNSIKSECDGVPANLVRECLLRLYGKEQLESKYLTAKGTRAGTMGIPDDVRLAIKAFANRNKKPGLKDLTNANITKIINRKNNQLRRSGGSAEKNKPKKSQKKETRGSPFNNPAPSSPLKSPIKQVHGKSPTKQPMESSPIKLLKAKSPVKSQVVDNSFANPNVAATSPWKVVPHGNDPAQGPSSGPNFQSCSNDLTVHDGFPGGSWNAWQQQWQHPDQQQEYNMYYFGNVSQQSSSSFGAPWQNAKYHNL